MDRWAKVFLERLEQAKVEVHLLKKYVDDVVIVCSMARRGDRVTREGEIAREMQT